MLVPLTDQGADPAAQAGTVQAELSAITAFAFTPYGVDEPTRLLTRVTDQLAD